MSAEDLLDFLDLMETHAIHLWLDGGWAVDACLGGQTRPHQDLDIAIEERYLAAAVAALQERGYAPVARDDTRAWNFVLGDGVGRQVDFHVIWLDAKGDGIYGPAENGQFYPQAALTGSGTIHGRAVSCISPEWLVHFHSGYAVDANDWADVSRLCERFGIPVPADYRDWERPPWSVRTGTESP